jgi:serine/threonine protein kinase
MGLVYRALDTKTKSDVALKTMRDASDPAAVEMFEKEWSLLASLSHPNIVDIRDVGVIEENGQRKPFFVMPLLRGTTLAKLIEGSSPRLTMERVVGIVIQVCRGLQVAHDHNLIHRDIKPSNIFVMEDDTAKIIDFGVVHLAGTRSVTGHKGTWQYMAPEQVDLKPATPISDLFSIGVVCYETLTGKRPFARPTPAETAEAVRKYIPSPVSEINTTVSPLMSRVIHAAMAKEPVHRFKSARELGDTLQKAYLNQPIERFDPAKIQPRIARAKREFAEGDDAFALEILAGLEAEGNIDLEITLLRGQIEQKTRQKKIRQLLESARTRLEQEEIPLALEKIQEILRIDPDNADALSFRSTIEKQRNEGQIESWLGLARKHLDRYDFAEARQALREVLRIRPSDTSAGNLLAETDRREQQSQRIRNERDQLYGSAMKAYQDGEMSSALSKLERILELGSQSPEAAIPERDAAYQVFYNRIRTERDAMQNAYETARRHLAEKAFTRALEICDDFSAKYPNDALFQALKLEVVEQQRQEQSAYIAEIGRRVDAESDLDRKVNILKEASERYPGEQQFQQLLKLTRERRDLVHSIVAKARHFEDRNQFAEAVGQWDILRNIYPRYPGIDLEIAQLSKRREAQAKDESKAKLVETIDRALDSGDFARALDLARSAVAENPQDQEFAGIERRAREGSERTFQARELLIRGQQLVEERRFEEAAEVLRHAYSCDPKSTLIRDSLLNVLVEQARPVVDLDWRKAEPLVQEACDLDATHPAARNIRGLLADAKRAEFVPQCLAEARDLQFAGKVEAALEKVEAGLKQYPNDVRLSQFHATLQNSVRGINRKQERGDDYEALLRLRQEATGTSAPDDWQSILGKSQSIWSKHPDDPEIGAVVSEIQQLASASQFRPAPPSLPIEDAPNSVDPVATVRRPDRRHQIQSVLSRFGRRLVRFPKMASAFLARIHVPLPAFLGKWNDKLRNTRVGTSQWWPVTLIVSIAALSLFLAFLLRPKPPVLVKPSPPRITVQLLPNPPDSIVTVNGAVRSGVLNDLDPRASYDVKVAKLGYQTYQAARKPEFAWSVTLEPELTHLRLATSAKAGKVFIDEQEKADLIDGSLPDLPVSFDGVEHTLSVRDGKKELLSLVFTVEPAKEPSIKQIKTANVQAITSLGAAATLYNSQEGLKANLVGLEPVLIPLDGLKLSPSEASHALAFDRKDLANVPIAIENFPVLYAGLEPKPTGTMKIACPIAGERGWLNTIVLTCYNGLWGINMPPGEYTLKIVAASYEPYEYKITLVQGDNPALKPALKELPVVASLKIEGGTPQSELFISGESKGFLDGSGSIAIPDIQPGSYQILLKKDGFDDLTISRQFVAGQTVTIGPNQASLKVWGSLIFEITPPGANITFRAISRGDEGTAKAGLKVPRPQGRYHVEAKFTGYQTMADDFLVESGKETPVNWDLTRTVVKGPDPKKDDKTQRPQPLTGIAVFGNPGQLEPVGDWLKLKTSDYVLLKPGFQHVTFTFSSPHKKAGVIPGKIFFVANFVDSRNKIEFELEDNTFNRRVYKGGTEDKGQRINKPIPHEKGAQYEIVLEFDKEQVAVSESGKEIDRVPAEGAMHGRIGLRGNSYQFQVQVR